ncbi:MAG: hypothetical protein K9G59_08165 [Caulobacter sp.]|nr:hypothetical protein [Caulobacter sp.]
MTALACLRILIDRTPDGGAPSTLMVRRVAAAFLVSRWSRPRRFGEVAPGVFLLTDPGAAPIDPDELIPLAMELRQEPVTFALLQGDEASATCFTALCDSDLRALLAGRLVVDAMPGRLSQVTPDGVRAVEPSPDFQPLRLIIEGAPVRAAHDDLRMVG